MPHNHEFLHKRVFYPALLAQKHRDTGHGFNALLAVVVVAAMESLLLSKLMPDRPDLVRSLTNRTVAPRGAAQDYLVLKVAC